MLILSPTNSPTTVAITLINVCILQTKIAVRKYNLLKQELTKKLFTNCRWVSSIAVHPRGVSHYLITAFYHDD